MRLGSAILLSLLCGCGTFARPPKLPPPLKPGEVRLEKLGTNVVFTAKQSENPEQTSTPLWKRTTIRTFAVMPTVNVPSNALATTKSAPISSSLVVRTNGPVLVTETETEEAGAILGGAQHDQARDQWAGLVSLVEQAKAKAAQLGRVMTLLMVFGGVMILLGIFSFTSYGAVLTLPAEMKIGLIAGGGALFVLAIFVPALNAMAPYIITACLLGVVAWYLLSRKEHYKVTAAHLQGFIDADRDGVDDRLETKSNHEPIP